MWSTLAIALFVVCHEDTRCVDSQCQNNQVRHEGFIKHPWVLASAFQLPIPFLIWNHTHSLSTSILSDLFNSTENDISVAKQKRSVICLKSAIHLYQFSNALKLLFRMYFVVQVLMPYKMQTTMLHDSTTEA